MAGFLQTIAGAWDAANRSITVGSNPNRVLWAAATWYGTGTVSGVSSNVNGAFTAVPGSLSTQSVGGRDQKVQWFYLINPTAGAHTITSSNTGSVNTKHIAVTETDATHQTTPYGTPVVTQSVAASYNHVITGTVVGDLAFSACNNGDTSGLAQTDITSGTLRWEDLETASWGTTAIGGTKPGEAGSTTITYNPIRTEGSAFSGVAIKDATVTAPPPRRGRPFAAQQRMAA